MIVLLAPSEGKTAPPTGVAPVDLSALSFPELTARRERLIAALAKLSAGPPKRALDALGLSAGQAGELERNADLLGASAAPAGEVYTGVLYQHLGLTTMTHAQRTRASDRLLVASALWGVVGIDDRIPAYRLGIGARLPRLGSLARWWRPALADALPANALVVDMRSQSYAAAWRPAAGALVEVRPLAERPDGRRSPISHMAKAVRGEIARLLVVRRGTPSDPEGVAAAVEAAGERVELAPPARDGGAWSLAVIRPAQP